MRKEEKWITFTDIPNLLTNYGFIIGIKYKIQSEDTHYYYLQKTKIRKDLENEIYKVGELKKPLISK